MYYSVSGGEEEDAQCIGLATAFGDETSITWTDSGQPITCTLDYKSNTKIDMPKSVDPAIFMDDDGSHHLVYGGGRIWMTELDPVTGRQIEDTFWSQNDTTYHYLAKGPTSLEDPRATTWIEAPFISKRDGFYYLFVNWFECCNNVDSAHEIRVGRAANKSGPYLDKEGVAMTDGGGSLPIERDGRYI